MGYSRAVRTGPLVEVSGTTATIDGQVAAPGDMREQTRIALQKIENALQRAGAQMQQVVRTRIYVTDINRWSEVAEVHAQYFRHIKPATSMVQVSRLIDSQMLVEIEATAWLDN